jgi:glutaredoxin
MRVRIYTREGCDQCRMLKEYLNNRCIMFEEINTTLNNSAKRQMLEMSGSGETPQTEIGDRIVIGFDQGLLDEEFTNEGLI